MNGRNGIQAISAHSGDAVFDGNDPTKSDDAFLVEIDRLRKIRNDVTNGNRKATEMEFDECHKVAVQAMWRLPRLGGVNYSSHYDEMGKLSVLPL